MRPRGRDRSPIPEYHFPLSIQLGSSFSLAVRRGHMIEFWLVECEHKQYVLVLSLAHTSIFLGAEEITRVH